MRLINLLLITSLLFLTGCKDEGDFYTCTLIFKETLETSYFYCKNVAQDKSVRITLPEAKLHGITNSNETPWVATDLDNYELGRIYYLNQCTGNQ